MYESPVNFVFQDVQSQITQDAERTILNVIGKCGVTVDKDELIKAMKYDRNQYTKGYKDGVNNTLAKLREEIKTIAFDWQEIDGEHESFMVVGLNDILKILDKYSKAESEAVWHDRG